MLHLIHVQLVADEKNALMLTFDNVNWLAKIAQDGLDAGHIRTPYLAREKEKEGGLGGEGGGSGGFTALLTSKCECRT